MQVLGNWRQPVQRNGIDKETINNVPDSKQNLTSLINRASRIKSSETGLSVPRATAWQLMLDGPFRGETVSYADPTTSRTFSSSCFAVKGF
jgi:hypothetical protein